MGHFDLGDFGLGDFDLGDFGVNDFRHAGDYGPVEDYGLAATYGEYNDYPVYGHYQGAKVRARSKGFYPGTQVNKAIQFSSPNYYKNEVEPGCLCFNHATTTEPNFIKSYTKLSYI